MRSALKGMDREQPSGTYGVDTGKDRTGSSALSSVERTATILESVNIDPLELTAVRARPDVPAEGSARSNAGNR